MVGTGKLSRVLWCKFHDIWFLVHLSHNQHFHFWFRPRPLQTKLHFPQKRQENAITHTHTLSLSHSHTLSLSLTHHTHDTHTHSLTPHTHTDTHTHSVTHSHTHTHTHTQLVTELRWVNVDIQFPQLRAYLPSWSICSPQDADGQQRQEKCEFGAATVKLACPAQCLQPSWPTPHKVLGFWHGHRPHFIFLILYKPKTLGLTISTI